MRALLKEGGSLRVAELPLPRLAAPDDVLLRVRLAGVCRTDAYVAAGRLAAADPLILGHEVAAEVVQVGEAVRGVAPGDLCTVSPLWPCRACAGCGSQGRCLSPQVLGVHRDGGFADYLVAPAAVVYKAPPGLAPRRVAYAEPLAAALAVLKAGLVPGQRGVIYGEGRIARLTQRVLAAAGLGDIPLHRPGAPLCVGSYDFAIETLATSEALSELVTALRPGGCLVLKSRPAEAPRLPVAQAVLRELRIIAVAYGSFDDALAWLAKDRIAVDDLLGPEYPLGDFAAALASSQGDEAQKIFLRPEGA